MYREKLTIDGRKYVITHSDNGTVVVEPPLPESLLKRFKKNISDIATTGRFPGIQTDTAFHANRGSLTKQLGGDEAWAKKITATARSKGAILTADHTYISQLAAYPGDPEAFVPPGEGRAYIRKLCEKRGKGCEGTVTVKEREKPPKKKIRLAEDLVRDRMRHYRQQGKVDRSVSNAELRTIVIDKHGQKA